MHSSLIMNITSHHITCFRWAFAYSSILKLFTEVTPGMLIFKFGTIQWLLHFQTHSDNYSLTKLYNMRTSQQMNDSWLLFFFVDEWFLFFFPLHSWTWLDARLNPLNWYKAYSYLLYNRNRDLSDLYWLLWMKILILGVQNVPFCTIIPFQ